MAPLILHNVPDDELYVGDDGVQRPYAMVFPQHDGLPTASRGRRGAQEKGSFGKSTRRSRSKAGTPARGIRDDPSVAAADRIWGEWKQTQICAAPATTATTATSSGQRKQGMRVGSQSLGREDSSSSSAPAQPRVVNVPTEIILRGYKNTNQQYAAVSHYESLAGRICEDYPREPPAEMRRYKSDLRDTALTQRRHLATEERAKVNRADGGEHWVKVTFESARAAEKAVYSSPQRIMGHLVHAELYHGAPPVMDEALPGEPEDGWGGAALGHRRGGSRGGSLATRNIRMNNGMPDWSSAATADSATMTSTSDSATATTGTVAGLASSNNGGNNRETSTGVETRRDAAYSRRIPTARRVQLLPAEQALMPQQSYAQRMLNHIPFVKWFTGNMIGSEVPRTETGEFDWSRASLYWKFIWWLDATFRIFGGDILNADKDD